MSNSHIEGLQRAVDLLGSRAALARALCITPVAVGQWLNAGPSSRGVPPKQCVRIEQLTHGAVTRKSLRPDDWRDFWPELQEFDEDHVKTPSRITQAANETVAQGLAHV